MLSSNTSLKIFGENIRARRLEIGLSQEELADLAGLHRTYIGAIERGERNVSFVNILRISRALGVQPSELFHRIAGK